MALAPFSRGRLAALESQLETLSKRVDAQTTVISAQRDRLNKQKGRLDAQHERLAGLERRTGELSTVYAVLEHQMASLETRMDRLHALVTDQVPPADEPERAEARALVDQIREEHSRIRTRFGVMARYEERIRRLERALEPEPNP